MDDWQQFFKYGMDRDVNAPLKIEGDVVLNIGGGKKEIPGTVMLDLPQWNADYDRIPFQDNSVDGIHCYHFLEHIKEPIKVLFEFQRVLRPGGIAQIVVPHYAGASYYQDLDHKHPFSEETWRNLFQNPYYTKNREGWKFKVHFNMIMAIVERNLALFTQLVRE